MIKHTQDELDNKQGSFSQLVNLTGSPHHTFTVYALCLLAITCGCCCLFGGGQGQGKTYPGCVSDNRFPGYSLVLNTEEQLIKSMVGDQVKQVMAAFGEGFAYPQKQEEKSN